MQKFKSNPHDFSSEGLFQLPDDVDGLGYRIWSRDRTQLVGEQYFLNDQPFQDLMVKVDEGKDSHIVLHVDHINSSCRTVLVQYSLDAQTWSDARVVQLNPINSNTNIVGPRFPINTLKQTPNPWIEIDVLVNLTHLRRRVRFGTNQVPDFNPPKRTGHGPSEEEKREGMRKWEQEQRIERLNAVAEKRAPVERPMSVQPQILWE